MKERFSYTVKGVKCDAKDCTYSDMSVPQEDYPNWVNRPCPECGANLFTEADFKMLQRLSAVTKFMNRLFPIRKEDEERLGEPIRFKGEANGTGQLFFEQVKSDAETEKK